MSESFGTLSLVRHTITVKSPDLTRFSENEWALNICFSAVNAQWGEDTLYYILYSDRSGQSTNWVLPCSGYIGLVTASHTVETWYPALRIIGGEEYDETYGEMMPKLYVEYFNTTTGAVTKATAVTDSNVWTFTAHDFRSEIATVAYLDNSVKVASIE